MPVENARLVTGHFTITIPIAAPRVKGRPPHCWLPSGEKIENRRVDSAAEAVSFVAQDQQRVIGA
jgi:hypothetical protein